MMKVLNCCSNKPVIKTTDKAKYYIAPTIKKFQSRKFVLTSTIFVTSTVMLYTHNLTQDTWLDLNKFIVGTYFASNVGSVIAGKDLSDIIEKIESDGEH